MTTTKLQRVFFKLKMINLNFLKEVYTFSFPHSGNGGTIVKSHDIWKKKPEREIEF